MTVKPKIQTSTKANAGTSPAGVVNALVHKPSGKTTSPFTNPSRLVEALRAGLQVRELEDLQDSLGIPMESLTAMLGISKSTLHRRRKADERFATDQSDRIVRYARLMRRAVDVFESEDLARQWLTTPQFGLGGAVPLEFAETEVGAREVEHLLGRIDHGVYA